MDKSICPICKQKFRIGRRIIETENGSHKVEYYIIECCKEKKQTRFGMYIR